MQGVIPRLLTALLSDMISMVLRGASKNNLMVAVLLKCFQASASTLKTE